jgi:TonB family protein
MNATAVRENWEGQVVDGKFPLLQWLGGSQGVAVFRTEVLGQKARKAAIKIISADPSSSQAQLDRWQNAASLSHPNLLRILHCGSCEINGLPRLYVVMELAEEDLSQVLPVRPLSAQETEAMLSPVVDALSYIHQKALVHGHIKPSNIMAAANELKLSSDSLRPRDNFERRAAQLSAYDAPEIESESGATAAADVWSLGATLVAVFTQHPPVWKRADAVEPRLPPSIPEPFYSIARGALRRNPADRITLEQIKGRLQPDEPVAVAKTKTNKRTEPPLTRPVWLVPVAVVLLLLAAFFAIRWATRGSYQATATVPPQVSVQTAAPNSASGTDRVPGRVLQQVEPNVSTGARRTIQGRVKVSVRLTVSPSGEVSEATLLSPGPSRYFANKALEAARGWKFKPAEVGGQPVASHWLLRFQFAQTKTDVVPTPVDR